MAHIDYFFTSVSPFTYLGHKALLAVAAKHGASISYRPVALAGLWAQSGAVPLGQRPAVRQRYRLIELQRLAEWRGLPLTLHPKHFPVDPTLADHVVIAMLDHQIDPTEVMSDLFAGVWANEMNIADEAAVRTILEKHGVDATAVLEHANSDLVAATRAENTEMAVAAGAIGAPAYVVDGEVFWGQDRIELLDHMIASGRPAYRPD